MSEGCPNYYVSTKLLAPVCGDDGNTYENVSVLKDAHCNSIKDIKVAFKGSCDGTDLLQPGINYILFFHLYLIIHQLLLLFLLHRLLQLPESDLQVFFPVCYFIRSHFIQLTLQWNRFSYIQKPLLLLHLHHLLFYWQLKRNISISHQVIKF